MADAKDNSQNQATPQDTPQNPPQAAPEAKPAAVPEIPTTLKGDNSGPELKIAGSDDETEAKPDLPHATGPKSDDGGEEDSGGGSKKIFWIIIAVLFVLIIGVGAAAWYANSTGKSITAIFFSSEEDAATDENEDPDVEEEEVEEPPIEEEDEEEAEEEEDADMTEEFEGEFVTATVPMGWIIIEHLNGNGTDMLVTGVTYTGLTGLEIQTDTAKTVFTMKGVNGIGGTDACDTLYTFSDTDPAYEQNVINTSAAIGVTTTITPIADGTYEAFDYLGFKVRRAGQNMYWDTTSNPGTYDTACGISAGVWQFTAPNFVADGASMGDYQVDVDAAVTTTELTLLDGVLDSMVAL